MISLKTAIFWLAMACITFIAPVITHNFDSVAYAQYRGQYAGSNSNARGYNKSHRSIRNGKLKVSPDPNHYVRQLYIKGRKLFSNHISCDNNNCLVGDGVIDDGNAAKYLVGLHNDERYLQLLDAEEMLALSVYMIRRYKLRD